MEVFDNAIHTQCDKKSICNAAVVDNDTDKTIVPGFFRVLSVCKKNNLTNGRCSTRRFLRNQGTPKKIK